MRATGGGFPALAAQSASRKSRARESAPPETPTAPGHTAPSASTCSISCANSRAEIASAAAVRFAFGERLIGDGFRSGRILVRERGKSSAAFLFLIHRKQRLAELQHAVGRTGTVRIFFQFLGERAGRSREV